MNVFSFKIPWTTLALVHIGKWVAGCTCHLHCCGEQGLVPSCAWGPELKADFRSSQQPQARVAKAKLWIDTLLKQSFPGSWLFGERELWLSLNIAGVSHMYPLQNPCFYGLNHSFRRLKSYSTEEGGTWFKLGKKNSKQTDRNWFKAMFPQPFSTTQGRAAYDMAYERESKGDWHTNPSCKQKSRKVSREVQGMIKSLTRNKRE